MTLLILLKFSQIAPLLEVLSLVTNQHLPKSPLASLTHCLHLPGTKKEQNRTKIPLLLSPLHLLLSRTIIPTLLLISFLLYI